MHKKAESPAEAARSADKLGLGGLNMMPWRREWLPTPVFLPREFNGQRSLAGYSSWDHKESDMTEPTKHTHKTFLGAASLLTCGKMRALLGGNPGSS